MMTRNLLLRSAPIAIAASAALYTVPATAQDAATAEPVILLPEPAPAAPIATTPAPAPTIVLPQTAAPAPVETAQLEQAAPLATQRTRTIAPRATAAGPVVRTQAVVPVGSASTNSTASAAPVALPVEAPVATVDTAAAAPVATSTSDNTGEIALAGLLGVLGLAAVGGVAVVASRRRRRDADVYDDTLAYEPVVDERHVEPVYSEPVSAVVPTAVRESDPVFSTTAPVASAFSAPVVGSASASRAPAARVSGDPIALPAEAPETFEERDALLRELVAAEPDKANPFTSPRARARRAKLIIQSLGRNFNSRKPRFDLSEYTNRWPALRGWQPATA